MSARFLGFTICAATAAGGLAVLAYVLQDGPERTTGSIHSEYVGFASADEAARGIPGAPGCVGACAADALFAQWQARHSDAKVLERTPVFSAGLLIGYDVRYAEP